MSNAPRSFPHRLGLQHRLDPQRDYHEHEDPTQPFPEGDVVVPGACWDQHPDAPKITKYYDPDRQWGDRRITPIENSQQFSTQSLLDLRLRIPAVCLVRLSSVDISGTLMSGATLATLFVQWQLFVGVGRALQAKMYQQLVVPNDGSVVNDLLLQWPIHALRVVATVFDTNAGITNPKYDVETVAQVAPFTSYPDMVKR